MPEMCYPIQDWEQSIKQIKGVIMMSSLSRQRLSVS